MRHRQTTRRAQRYAVLAGGTRSGNLWPTRMLTMNDGFKRVLSCLRLPFLGGLWLTLLLLAETTLAEIPQQRYDVHIDGMVCAYCAYNVSKRLAQLEAVVPGSVQVDLEAKQVRFDARTEVSKSMIDQALADSGFTVKTIEWKALDSQEESGPYDRLEASIHLPVVALGSTLTEHLLDALGAAATAQHGRLVVQAPANQESALLKPLLAGRRPAIPVEFHASESDTVTVSFWTQSPAPGGSHE